MNSIDETYYERRLQREIEEINVRIRELTQEKAALERQLMKARRESSGLADVNRKNSVNRIMIENRVIDELRANAKPLPFRALLATARYVDFQLKEGTFRTTLHRMKNKGLIREGKQRGSWMLPD